MTTKQTSPATKTFRVWADNMQRVFQDVEAVSPERAHAHAQDNPDDWEQCDEHYDGIHMSSDVMELATEKYFTVGEHQQCRSCGDDLVEGINDSKFRDGECGPCEYQTYRSRSDLLQACEAICGLMYRDKHNDERIDFDQYERAERACKRSIAKARGKTH